MFYPNSIIIESRNEFYNNMQHDSLKYTLGLMSGVPINILNRAYNLINKFNNEKYKLFKFCISQFENMEY
jgi:hypothetical protein